MSRQTLPGLFSNSDTPAFLRSMQQEVNQMLERFRSGQPERLTEFLSANGASDFPAIDVAETDDAIEITAEVPGMEEDDLDVSVAGGVLTLKGEKSSDREESDKDYYLVERRYGAFRRQVPLGFAPEDGAVTAEFRDGLLKLTIAKPAETKAAVQKIDIKKS
ncbi:Hsp20/alpha crystallin family protein [Aestuariivita sp.]|uniref:Hsp20/alpha crystallin family protein n=1 Tax=Aestuariivita sp. TaxID=1872407 RepID=UPI0021711727|nr:Hsp20/alpha crystallin family protein [Aestuariivita sp.]MCE8005956.1 Hsp20/alpha crystallin family protein [Aestuariivita sp.]